MMVWPLVAGVVYSRENVGKMEKEFCKSNSVEVNNSNNNNNLQLFSFVEPE